MESENIYTAITVGPIIDTLSLSSSPAALWASSYMFSYITRKLCEDIVNKKLVESEEDIISPYYSVNKEYDANKCGIGLYHDRIVFKPMDTETVLDELNKCFQEVTKEISDLFDVQSESWFEQYLQFHALNFESTANPILDCSQYLDALELEKTFPVGEMRNPINDMFESRDKNKKIYVRISKKLTGGKWPFPYSKYQGANSEDQIAKMADMEEITGRRKETEQLERTGLPRIKRNSYYAIVQADGDRFGDYIKNHSDPRAFSEQCLLYCNKVAMEIQNYGGVTIYAGGDDVLFIAPLSSPKIENENLLSLLTNLRDIFMSSFNKNPQQTDSSVDGQSNDLAGKSPTVSFGVAIRYYKYPLYEAFSECLRLLFTNAKMERDSLAISLQKHSGQSSEFTLTSLSNSDGNKLFERLQQMITTQITEECLQSVRGKIYELRFLFLHALRLYQEDQAKHKDIIRNLFENLFNRPEHRENKGENDGTGNNMDNKLINDIENIRDLLILLVGLTGKREIVNKNESPKQNNDDNLEMILNNLDKMLRFIRFWDEKGNEEDE